MPLATCLVNEPKKQYCVIYGYTSDLIGTYLTALEKYKHWNLRHDEIYVELYKERGFTNVTQEILISNTGGEIIYEYLNQHG